MTAGRALISIGLLIAALGALLIVLEKMNLPLGRLPGDLLVRKGRATVYVPFTTCVLISAAASLLVWLVNKR